MPYKRDRPKIQKKNLIFKNVDDVKQLLMKTTLARLLVFPTHLILETLHGTAQYQKRMLNHSIKFVVLLA